MSLSPLTGQPLYRLGDQQGEETQVVPGTHIHIDTFEGTMRHLVDGADAGVYACQPMKHETLVVCEPRSVKRSQREAQLADSGQSLAWRS